jgi:hypothetical protein
MNRYVPDIPSSDSGLLDLASNLNKYNLEMDDDRTGPSLRREKEARQQLALDLALSSHVFASRPFSTHDRMANNEDDAFDAMSRAAEAMSLQDSVIDEIPPVKFSILNPLLKNHEDEDQFDQSKEEQPLGVRLLLQEWEPSADPSLYEYFDPYATGGPSATPYRSGQTSRTMLNQAPSQMSQCAPPTIAPSRAVPPILASSQVMPPSIMPSSQPFSQRPLGGTIGSMPDFTSHMFTQPQMSQTQSQLQSQDIMASTQITPGPFDGRVIAKKPAKKRVGGF